MLENVSLELWEDFRFALRWKCIPLSLKWFIETAALWKEEGKKKGCVFVTSSDYVQLSRELILSL